MALLINQVQAPIQATNDFGYEITVESPIKDAAPFNLAITGVILTPGGKKTPFKMNRKNLKTPYQFNLKNGRYTVVVESQARGAGIISKVQGMKAGKKMGSASADFPKTILEFGFEGNYAARGE